MSCYNISDYFAFGYVRAAYDEWDVDVFFEATCLAGREAMLANVEAIVG
jgi:hypothetical protein